MSDLGEQQFNRMYEDFQKEQMRLMTELRNGTEDKEITKQISLINGININILRLRNLRKTIADKINM
jgi:hypothetical protein